MHTKLKHVFCLNVVFMVSFFSEYVFFAVGRCLEMWKIPIEPACTRVSGATYLAPVTNFKNQIHVLKRAVLVSLRTWILCVVWLLIFFVVHLKTQTRRPRREDNIKMDLGGIGFGDVNWIHLVQDRGRWRALVNTVMSLRVAQSAGNFLTSWAYS
jgi:hypothetical protein